jgi:Fe-S protein assembly co-chaperone HscB
MIDYFAWLNEPRRPWLDPESLKGKFLALSAQAHPDRIHNASESEKRAATQLFAELNAAYQCLREPKSRLRYLLELERGTKLEEIQRIPSGTLEWFAEVVGISKQAQALLKEKPKVVSPLLKVDYFERSAALAEQMNRLQQVLNSKIEELSSQIKTLNGLWESAPPVGNSSRCLHLPCERLEELYRELSIITRWVQQLQEWGVQLAL